MQQHQIFHITEQHPIHSAPHQSLVLTLTSCLILHKYLLKAEQPQQGTFETQQRLSSKVLGVEWHILKCKQQKKSKPRNNPLKKNAFPTGWLNKKGKALNITQQCNHTEYSEFSLLWFWLSLHSNTAFTFGLTNMLNCNGTGNSSGHGCDFVSTCQLNNDGAKLKLCLCAAPGFIMHHLFNRTTVVSARDTRNSHSPPHAWQGKARTLKALRSGTFLWHPVS